MGHINIDAYLIVFNFGQTNKFSSEPVGMHHGVRVAVQRKFMVRNVLDHVLGKHATPAAHKTTLSITTN